MSKKRQIGTRRVEIKLTSFVGVSKKIMISTLGAHYCDEAVVLVYLFGINFGEHRVDKPQVTRG